MLVSISVDGEPGNGSSYDNTISSNGQFVVFMSEASNLVESDRNHQQDIFVRDLINKKTYLVSVASDGTQGSQESDHPSISSDGKKIVFHSGNVFGSDDKNKNGGIYLHDLDSRKTTWISKPVANLDGEGNEIVYDGGGYNPVISGDGKFVFFLAEPNDLGLEGTGNLIVYDVNSKTLSAVELNVESGYPGYAVSDNGKKIVFTTRSEIDSFPDSDRGDLFVYDVDSEEFTWINQPIDEFKIPSDNRRVSIDSVGRYVAFQSSAPNLVEVDTNDDESFFLHDLQTSETKLISITPSGTQFFANSWIDISGNGKFVLFQDGGMLVYDVELGKTIKLTDDGIDSSGIDFNGEFISFISRNNDHQIFVSTNPPPIKIPEPVVEEPVVEEPVELGIASFVDATKDPQSYVDRYNNEPEYKKWFDENYPQYDSIYHAVGLDNPTDSEMFNFIVKNYLTNIFSESSNAESSDTFTIKNHMTPEICGDDLECYDEIVGLLSNNYGLTPPNYAINVYHFEHESDLENYFSNMSTTETEPEYVFVPAPNFDIYCEAGKHEFSNWSETGIICKEFPIAFRVFSSMRDSITGLDVGAETSKIATNLIKNIHANPLTTSSKSAELPLTITSENTDDKLGIASFVDATKDPQSYVERYENEASYKKWFDENYPQYDSIYHAVGLESTTESTTESEPSCGAGTIEQDGMCVVDTAKTTSEKSSKGGGCLIATATYGSELAPEVQKLRELRDNSLLSTESGTNFIELFNDVYYSFSPVIADYERENPVFKEMVKITITPLLSSLSIMQYAETDSEVLGIGISVIVMNIGMYFVAPAIVIVGIKRKL